MMSFQKHIDFLLETASPNIVYRVKKEILKESVDTPEMLRLQSKITDLPKVKKAFACQRENGFSRHGFWPLQRTGILEPVHTRA